MLQTPRSTSTTELPTTVEITGGYKRRYPPHSVAHTAGKSLRNMLVVLIAILAPQSFAQTDSQFPVLSGQVVDQAGLLDTTTRGEITSKLQAHEAATTNQVVVVTLKSLDGNDIADYANRLGRHWGIGTSENDNGVLLVVAPEERKVRIEVGYGLEGALTDALSSSIIRNDILPLFRDKAYRKGIKQGVDSILLAIAGEYVAQPGKSGSNRSSSANGFIPAIFIGLIGLMELLKRTGRYRLARGAFPAGFGGLFGTIITGKLLIGLAAAVALFLLIYFTSSNKPFARSGGRGGYIGGGGGFGGSSGGGFGGGGGGFGGGGASGGW